MIPGYHANAMIEFDLATAGSVLRRIGFGAVAVRTSLAKLDPLADDATRVWQFSLLQAGIRGMRLVLDGDGPFLVDPWQPNPPGLADETAESQRHREYLKAAVELVGELGGGLVTFSVGRIPEGRELQHALDRLADAIHSIQKAITRIGNFKVDLAVRPRAGHLVDSIGSFERLLEWVGVNSDLKLAADVGVMVGGGEMPILDLLARLEDRLGCVYLSDLRLSDLRGPGGGSEATLGLGHVSIQRVVAGLKAGGFTGPVILEPVVGCGVDPGGARRFFEQVFRNSN